MQLLEEVCGEDRILYELTRELIDVERRFKTLTKRAGLYPAMEKAFRRNFYDSREDATNRALGRRELKEAIEIERRGSVERYGSVDATSLNRKSVEELLETINGEDESW